MRSGMRAPLDSPSSTSGSPRLVATCFTCLIFFMLMTLDDAPSTVKSFETSPTSRPSMRANPATLPSAGVRARISGRCEVANMPDSLNEPASIR
jgi:hypothetical protein